MNQKVVEAESTAHLMMVTIMLKFETVGLEELQSYFKHIEKKIESSKPWFETEAVPRIADFSKKRFATEGDGRWPALTAEYKRWKEEHYPGQKIGHLTGRARREQESNDPPHASTDDMLTVFTELDHFEKFQGKGGRKKRRLYDQAAADDVARSLEPAYEHWIVREVLNK